MSILTGAGSESGVSQRLLIRRLLAASALMGLPALLGGGDLERVLSGQAFNLLLALASFVAAVAGAALSYRIATALARGSPARQ